MRAWTEERRKRRSHRGSGDRVLSARGAGLSLLPARLQTLGLTGPLTSPGRASHSVPPPRGHHATAQRQVPEGSLPLPSPRPASLLGSPRGPRWFSAPGRLPSPSPNPSPRCACADALPRCIQGLSGPPAGTVDGAPAGRVLGSPLGEARQLKPR